MRRCSRMTDRPEWRGRSTSSTPSSTPLGVNPPTPPPRRANASPRHCATSGLSRPRSPRTFRPGFRCRRRRCASSSATWSRTPSPQAHGTSTSPPWRRRCLEAGRRRRRRRRRGAGSVRGRQPPRPEPLPPRRRPLRRRPQPGARPRRRHARDLGTRPEPAVITVLVVDDHNLFRVGLRRHLEDDSDVRLVGEAATAEQAVVKARALQPDLVLLDLLLPGKSGYDEPQLGAKLVVADRSPALEPLSDRERDVLHLLALGYTNHEIGQRLFISVRTVDSHRAHIWRKLQFETRAELVLFALANGLIGPS